MQDRHVLGHESCMLACISFLSLTNMHYSGSLSGNKGLCGVPTLPACALFWEKGGLNKTGKIALGASFGFVLLVILIVVYILCIRRGPYDYDFEFPQDLTCKYTFSINFSPCAYPPMNIICDLTCLNSILCHNKAVQRFRPYKNLLLLIFIFTSS